MRVYCPRWTERSIAVQLDSGPRFRLAARLLYRRQRQNKPEIAQTPRLGTTLCSLLLEMGRDQELRQARCSRAWLQGWQAGIFSLAALWDFGIT